MDFTLYSLLKKKSNNIINDTRERNFGLIWIKWTNNLLNGFSDTTNAAQFFSTQDIIATQTLNLNSLAPKEPEKYGSRYTEKSNEIFSKAKKINPKLKRVEYIHVESERRDFSYNDEYAYLNPDGTWEGSTADLSGCSRIYTKDQFRDWFKYFKSVGADGVFFDDWGYEWSIDHISWQMGYDASEFSTLNEAINKKWIDLINMAHDEGLFIITNGGWQHSVGDWYTYLNENDIICFESNLVSSYQGYIENGQTTLYNYLKDWYLTGKCKAEAWSLNYYPPDCSGEFKQKVTTYIMNMALSAGARYVSVGVGGREPLPSYFTSFLYGDKTISKISNYAYRITSGNTILETYRDSSISGTLTEYKINQCYSIYDGHEFRNAYADAKSLDANFNKRIENIEESFENMSDDNKRNAQSFWRMRIDDWQLSKVYNAYTNVLETINQTYVSPVEGDINDFTVTYANEGWHGMTLFNLNFSDERLTYLKGKTIEFGVMKFEFSMQNGRIPKQTLKIQTVSEGTKYTSLSTSMLSTLEDNIDGYCYAMRVPEDCISIAFQMWDSWVNASNAGTLHCEKAYLIDINEIDEEITKTWYSNLITPIMNNTSLASSKYSRTSYRGRTVFNVESYATDPWGWCAHTFSSEEVIELRGKTIEFGCIAASVSDGSFLGYIDTANGNKNLAFGVGVSTTGTNPLPVTYPLKCNSSKVSEIWGEEMYFVRFTVPVNAIGLSFGFRSNGCAANTIVNISNLYMYNVDEEELIVRGVDSANSSLAFCRVSEDIENKDPNTVKNALYVSDKGNMWMVDNSGTQTDINKISVIPAYTSGTLIATIIVNGEEHKLYLPPTTE